MFVDAVGKVEKVARCDGQCKLVIQPGDVPSFVVFADFLTGVEPGKRRKVRKGSSVRLWRKLLSFVASAVCLFAA